MIPAPTDSPEMEGERQMLIPAGDWYKMPANAVPLTDAWAVAAMQPRYNTNGEVTYALTPPRDQSGPGLRILVAVFFLGLCVLPWLYFR